MAQPEKLTTQDYIIDRLQDIQRKTEAGKYTEALASIKEVKAADTKNIYLVAIEKQIAKLSDASLPEENRTAIVKSLPAMIGRAVSDIQRKAPQPQPTPQQQPAANEPQKGQKEAALEKLKKQYFQRADEYVEKKEYQHALEEIRRIYIIEPGSVVAKEYEKKIEQLSALQSRSEAQAASAAEVKENKKAASVLEEPKEKVVLEEEPQKSKMPLIAGAVAAIVILAVGGWFLFSKSSGNKPLEPLPAQQPAANKDSVASAPIQSVPDQSTKSSQSTAGNSKKTDTKPSASDKKPAATQTTPAKTSPTTPAKTSPTTPAKTTTAAQPAKTQQQPTQQPPASTVQQPPASSTESTPAPMPFVAIETQPEIITRGVPEYPEIARKMGIQGRVTVEVTVDAQGKPIQAKVVKTSSEIFNDAAIQAVMKYTFKPAMMSTGPVTAKVYIPIDFRMKR
jgi:periplasmic protein TonB